MLVSSSSLWRTCEEAMSSCQIEIKSFKIYSQACCLPILCIEKSCHILVPVFFLLIAYSDYRWIIYLFTFPWCLMASLVICSCRPKWIHWMSCSSIFPIKKVVFMSCAHGEYLDCPMMVWWLSITLSPCVLVEDWVPPAEVGVVRGRWKLWWDDSHVHQQKQNVISIGKYSKVFQPFKMKQNLPLQNVSSSHCSSLTYLFQGKQMHFDLKWLMLIPAQNQPFPTTRSVLGEDFVVIQTLLAVFIPASLNRKFPALFV